MCRCVAWWSRGLLPSPYSCIGSLGLAPLQLEEYVRVLCESMHACTRCWGQGLGLFQHLVQKIVCMYAYVRCERCWLISCAPPSANSQKPAWLGLAWFECKNLACKKNRLKSAGVILEMGEMFLVETREFCVRFGLGNICREDGRHTTHSCLCPKLVLYMHTRTGCVFTGMCIYARSSILL